MCVAYEYVVYETYDTFFNRRKFCNARVSNRYSRGSKKYSKFASDLAGVVFRSDLPLDGHLDEHGVFIIVGLEGEDFSFTVSPFLVD
jgi:hypothetical protein